MAKISILLAAVSAMATGVAAPAVAAEDDPPRAVVRYGDLNLASAAGRDRLTVRVRMAVRRMCGSMTRLTLQEQVATRRCITAAYKSAEPQLAKLFSGAATRIVDRDGRVLAAP